MQSHLETIPGQVEAQLIIPYSLFLFLFIFNRIPPENGWIPVFRGIYDSYEFPVGTT